MSRLSVFPAMRKKLIELFKNGNYNLVRSTPVPKLSPRNRSTSHKLTMVNKSDEFQITWNVLPKNGYITSVIIEFYPNTFLYQPVRIDCCSSIPFRLFIPCYLMVVLVKCGMKCENHARVLNPWLLICDIIHFYISTEL
jgi:hypothetical protein